jgi:hypothetical protein
MNIIPEYDSSVDNAPAGYKTAVEAAINFVDHLITNPITVTLDFSYGEILNSTLGSGTLGESSTNGNIETYSALVGYLTAAATSTADKESLATLPSTDPTNGGRFWVSDTQAKIFGLGSEAGYTDSVDGYVALSSKYTFSYDPTDRQVSGEYDAIGVLEHEITEALGRISDLGMSGSYQGYTLWTPLDLFRYSAPGQHEYTISNSSQAGYFSVDGQNMLLKYNNPSNGEDGGDWDASVVGDSFGDGFEGRAGLVSPTDVLEMDVQGFTINYPGSTDFHNDGLANLLIQNSNGAVDIGEVSSGSIAWEQLGGLGSEWKFVGTGDFLGDGLSDYLIESTNGAVVAAEVGPDTTAAYTQVAALGPEWAIVGAGNLLGNGKADMLIENTNGAVDVGEADPVTSQMAYTQVGALGAEWKFVGVGDYLGLGRQEFLIESTNGAVDVGDIVSGKAQYTQVAALGSEWTFAETGDFLNDGKAQFLIESTSGAIVVGEVGSNGQAAYTQVGGLGAEWKFVGVGDYLGLGYDQFLIESTNGAVDVGKVSGGQVQYTQVTGLGSSWTFHQ